MDIFEALDAMYKGNRIREKTSRKDFYWYIHADTIYNSFGNQDNIPIDFNNMGDVWEIYYLPEELEYKSNNSIKSELVAALDKFQEINHSRCNECFKELYEYPSYYYTNAMSAEAGEAAGDARKIADIGDDDSEESKKLLENLAYELADTVTYAALVAEYYGWSLGELIVEKFNIVSNKNESDIRI